MSKKVIICFVVCLLSVSAGWADNVSKNHTLDSLIQVALERNPSIQTIEHQFHAAEHRAGYAGWLPDPQFSIGLLNLPRTSFGFDETPMTGVSVGLTQSIPWPGKLSTQTGIAHLNAEAMAADLAARKNSIIRLVTYYYYDYSYWVRADDILHQNLNLIDDIIAVAQTRYANGMGSLQDVLRSETSRSRLENRILVAGQKSSSALIQLGWLTDKLETVLISLTPFLPPIPSNARYGTSDISNPILAGASLRSVMAAKRVDLARLSYWPDLMFGVDYRIRKNIPMDPVRGEDFLTFKVGLKVPLWFFVRQRNQTAAARQSFLGAQAKERTIINEIEQRILDVGLALQSLMERVEQYDHAILPQARATSEAAQVAYETGQLDFDGFLATQLDVMNIELERLDLLRQYNQQAAMLQELTAGDQGVK